MEFCELHWARGLLQRWDGDEGSAVTSIEQALLLAREDEDRWREYKCLTWLSVLALERGRALEAYSRCSELTAVASKLGQDETPFAMTLTALAELEQSNAIDEQTSLTTALNQLRAVDNKSYLAIALNLAAWSHLRAGQLEIARSEAREALSSASTMHRQNEVAIAQAILASVGESTALRALQGLEPDILSARARATISWCRGKTPTLVSTVEG